MKKYILMLFVCTMLLTGCSKKEYTDNQKVFIDFANDYVQNVDYPYDNDDWTIIEQKNGLVSAITRGDKNGEEVRVRCDWTASDKKLHFVEVGNEIKYDDGYLDKLDNES